MSEDKKTVGKGILIDHLAGLALAFAVSFSIGWLLRAFGVNEEFASNVNLFCFFALLFSDPVAAWRGSQSWRKFAIKIAVGLITALVLAMVFNLMFPETGTPQAQAADAAPVEESEGSFAWIMLMPVIIIPIVFLAPTLERVLSGEGPKGEPLTSEDLQIGLTFPLYITAHFLLLGVVAGALWLVDVPWSVGVIVLTLGVLCAVAEAWLAGPDDSLPEWDEDGKWQPRAESAAEAWSGLRMAIRTSFTSALFLGGMTFTTVSLAVSMGDNGMALDDGMSFLLDFAWIIGVVLGGSLALLLYGLMLTATLAYVVARLHGLDPLAMEHLAKQALGRLFMGGMSYVRPDIDEDEAAR